MVLILLLGSPSGLRAEPSSVTFIDRAGDPFIYNGMNAGDVIEGRLFFGARFEGPDPEFVSTAEDPFFNDGNFLSLAGLSLSNIDNTTFPVLSAGSAAMTLTQPRTEVSITRRFGVPGVDHWKVGERVVVHRSYPFRARDIELSPWDSNNAQWTYGILLSHTEGLGDEFSTPFSSFGIISRHPRASHFGFINRDDTGELLDDVLYFRNTDFGGTVATASGPLVAALDNRLGPSLDEQSDSMVNLVLETTNGIPGETADRGGLLATVGFPRQSYPGTRTGPFAEFFAVPRDLTNARIRLKISDVGASGMTEARLVVADSVGSTLATVARPIPGGQADWRFRPSDFTVPLSEQGVDVGNITDLWLEVFVAPSVVGEVTAFEILIDRVDIEVRQPKVLLTVEDPVLRLGQSTSIRWQSAEAESCVGSGLLPGSLPLNGSIEVSTPGTAEITCQSANSQTIDASDAIEIRPAAQTVVFPDDPGDGWVVEVEEVRLDIAQEGWYQVTATASADNPFPQGSVGPVVKFFNADASTYDIENAVLFGEHGFPVGTSRRLQMYTEVPTTRLVWSGRSDKLADWTAGDRIAMDTLAFGSPFPDGVEYRSGFYTAGFVTPPFEDQMPAGQIVTLAIAETVDSDGDGIGDIANQDDDNDQMPDEFENANGLDRLDPADALADRDGDGYSNVAEYLAGTDIDDPRSNPGASAAAVGIVLELLLEEDAESQDEP